MLILVNVQSQWKEEICRIQKFLFCLTFHLFTEPIVAPVQKCPLSSVGGYIITIQYLLICKLVLVTLLFAMFA